MFGSILENRIAKSGIYRLAHAGARRQELQKVNAANHSIFQVK
jgi:hypothetical protein